jgi:DNA cross-link repair 1C protein
LFVHLLEYTRTAFADRRSLQLVPLSRHSPLPELKQFVSLFRPRRVVPNTLLPALHGLDWAYANRAFAPCLSPTAQIPSDKDVVDFTWFQQNGFHVDADAPEAVDAALKNLEGMNVEAQAAIWAENSGVRKRLKLMQSVLDGDARAVVDRILGGMPMETEEVTVVVGEEKEDREDRRMLALNSDEETDDGDDDERGRTAHRLFAALAGVDGDEPAWWGSPSSSQRSSAGAGNGDQESILLAGEVMSRAITTPVAENGAQASSYQRLPPTPRSSSPGDPGPSTVWHRRSDEDEPPRISRGLGQPASSSRNRCATGTLPPPAAPRLLASLPTNMGHGVEHHHRGHLDNIKPKTIASFSNSDISRHQALAPAPRSVNVQISPVARKRRRLGDKIHDTSKKVASSRVPHRSEPPVVRHSATHVTRSSHRSLANPCSGAPPDDLKHEHGNEVSSRSREDAAARRERKRAAKAQLESMTENLRRAAGDTPLEPLRVRTTPFTRLGSRSVRGGVGSPADEHGGPCPTESFSTVHAEGDRALDWERSREVRDGVRAQIDAGLRPILPTLSCIESQSAAGSGIHS